MFGSNKALACDKRNQRIFLQVCIATECPLRNKCAAYASVDAATESQAITDVESHGHHAAVSAMPLLQAQGVHHG